MKHKYEWRGGCKENPGVFDTETPAGEVETKFRACGAEEAK